MTPTKKKQRALKLPVHRASGNYYKCIGKVLGNDGQPKPKIWYFAPHDLAAAVTKIGELKSRWKALTAAGKTLWDEDPSYAAERTTVAANERQRLSAVLTVSDGFASYLATIEQAWTEGQCEQSHYTSQMYRLQALKSVTITYRGEPRKFGTLPLPAIGRQELETAVLTICNRPLVTRHHYEGAEERAKEAGAVTHKKMSIAYAKACKATLKTCFNWLSEETVWTRCPHWSAIWKHDVVITDEELEEQIENEDGEVDHFELDELIKLWRATDDTSKPTFWKTLILLSLNCGFANAECATLRGREVKLVTAGKSMSEYVIER